MKFLLSRGAKHASAAPTGEAQVDPSATPPPALCGWQPIETAPEDEVILVCDTNGERPVTIAVVERFGNSWAYVRSHEVIDFTPECWLERDISRNPYHVALPPVTP
jgi:hypothetical protein